MSLKLKKNDNYLEIIEGDLPSKEEFRVFTEDEVLQFEGWKQWMTLSEEAREDMMRQTQSVAYQEWMEEADWDECSVDEDPASYGNNSFKA